MSEPMTDQSPAKEYENFFLNCDDLERRIYRHIEDSLNNSDKLLFEALWRSSHRSTLADQAGRIEALEAELEVERTKQTFVEADGHDLAENLQRALALNERLATDLEFWKREAKKYACELAFSFAPHLEPEVQTAPPDDQEGGTSQDTLLVQPLEPAANQPEPEPICEPSKTRRGRGGSQQGRVNARIAQREADLVRLYRDENQSLRHASKVAGMAVPTAVTVLKRLGIAIRPRAEALTIKHAQMAPSSGSESLQRRNFVVAALRAGCKTASDIAETTNLYPADIYTALAVLEQAGLIVKTKKRDRSVHLSVNEYAAVGHAPPEPPAPPAQAPVPDGQREKCEKLLRENDTYIVAQANRVSSGNSTFAEDVAQEARIRAFRSFASFRGDATFKTWITRIVMNCANDLRRKERRHPAQNLELPDGNPLEIEDRAESPLAMVLRSESEDSLYRQIAILPESAQAVLLAELHDETYQAMADTFDLPIGTVKSRLFRAKKLLEEAMAVPA